MIRDPQGPGPAACAGDPFADLRSRYLRAAMVIHLGEFMAMLVTSYLVYRGTRSVAATGLILLCFNVPALALAGAATALSRRFGAPAVDAWLNGVESLWAVLPTALAATGHLTVPLLLLWVLGYGVAEGLNAPNSYLVRQTLAAPGRLAELNGSYTRNVALSAVLGMVLGGAIYEVAGSAWVFGLSALCTLPEVRVLSAVARRDAAAGERHGAAEGFGDALRLLRTEPGLWAACRYAALCFFVASYSVTLPAIARSIGSSAEILSVLEAGSLAGGILVAVAVRRVHGRARWAQIQRLCYFGAGLGLAAMAAAEYLGGSHSRTAAVVALATTVPIGFAVLMNATIVTSAIQVATPHERRASMFTLLALIPLVVGPLSQEMVGALADRLSVPAALLVVALATMAANVAISRSAMGRHFDRLDESDAPPSVNHLLTHRGGHRTRHPHGHPHGGPGQSPSN